MVLKRLKRKILTKKFICFISLFILIGLMCISYLIASSECYIKIHESLHCFGAKILNANCVIVGARAETNPPLIDGSLFNSLIFSGMPYFFTYLIFYFFVLIISKLEFLKDYVLREISVILFSTLMMDLIVNLVLIYQKGNDFGNIFFHGQPVDRIVMVVFLSFYILLIFEFIKLQHTERRKVLYKLV